MGVGVAVAPNAAAAGPYLVKDIATGENENRGPNSIWFLPGTQAGFFTADTPGYGSALWITDGTEAGTRLVRDIVSDLGMMQGDPNSAIARVASSRSDLLAREVGGIAYLEVEGRLWKSDGTYSGTEPIASVDVLAMTEFLGALYFVAEEPERGTLLFRSDGTREGTTPIAILPDGGGAAPYVTLIVGDSALWILTNRHGTPTPNYPLRAWKSDGTGPGTQPVPVPYSVVRPTPLGDDLLYFQPDASIRLWELWRSDGTSAGTRVVGSAQATGGFNKILSSVMANGTLFFLATDSDGGVSLWRSDGTPEGTVKVYPTPASSDPVFWSVPSDSPEMVVLGASVVFSCDDGAGGTGIWTTDGTAAGTRLVADHFQYSDLPNRLTVSKGFVFFTAPHLNTARRSLWVTDGTPEGTRSVLPPGLGPSNPPSDTYPYLYPDALAPFTDGVYFRAVDGIHGEELWKSDGTPEGTLMVKDLVPPTNSSSRPFNFVEIGNSVVFTAETPEEGREFWRTNGTAEGTQLVRDVQPGPERLVVFWGSLALPVWNDLLFFTQKDPTKPIATVWRTDGSAAGTQPLVEFPLLNDSYYYSGYGRLDFWPSVSSDPGPLLFALHDLKKTATASGEDPVFPAQSQDMLYRTDGTPTGNYPLKAGWTEYLDHAGDTTIFLSDPAHYDRLSTEGMIMNPPASLWATDGTIEKTLFLAELPPGDVRIKALTEFGGVLYLAIAYVRPDRADCNCGRSAESIWRTDGTADGTYPLVDGLGDYAMGIHPPEFFGVANGHPVFGTNPYVTASVTLWSTDGSREGTVPFYTGVNSADAYGTIGGKLMFTAPSSCASNHADKVTLWSTDGTAEGTLPVRELFRPQYSLYSPLIEYQPVVLGNRIVFFCEDVSGGSVLWSTDGTSDGTGPIRPMTPSRGASYRDVGRYYSSDGSTRKIVGEVLSGDRLVFAGDDGIHGAELWVTDGSPAGTRLLRDIQPGPLDSGIAIANLNSDRIHFSANDGVTGYELWVTDGTPLGTVRLTDLNPGPGGFRLNASVVHDDTLFLHANDGSGIGEELWALPLADLPLPTQTERDILPRILNQPGAPVVDDQNADAALDIADFIRARGER